MNTIAEFTDELDARLLLNTLTALKKGDFSARMPSDWTGLAGKIADTVNDIIEIKNSNAARQLAAKNLEIAASRAVPDWLSLDKDALRGVLMRIPTRDEIQPIANEQAVVEFYSR